MKRALVLALAVLLVAASISPVFAEEQTTTINMKVSVGFLGKTAMGTMVIKNDCLATEGPAPWSFTGQVDGQQASASGLATVKWTGSGYEATITQVDTWDMGGVSRPNLPLTGSIIQDTSGAIWGVVNTRQAGPISIPLAIQGVSKLPAPCQGNAVFDVTNVAGVQEITGLPKTGSAPELFHPFMLVLAAAGIAALTGSRLIARRIG